MSLPATLGVEYTQVPWRANVDRLGFGPARRWSFQGKQKRGSDTSVAVPLTRQMAGYVRVSANTYAYGLRRGFALLVTGVTL